MDASTSSSSSSSASKLLSSARSSRRSAAPVASTSAKSRQFTLARAQAKEIEERAVVEAVREFLSEETHVNIDSVEDLESGVALCKLVARFGQVVRYKDPPQNEFQRLENFRLFGLAVTGLKVLFV